MIDNDRMSYFDSGLQVFLSDSAIERGLKRLRTVSSEFQFPSQFPHSRPAVTGWSPAWRRKHTVTPASLLLLPNQKGDNFYSRFSPKLSSTFFPTSWFALLSLSSPPPPPCCTQFGKFKDLVSQVWVQSILSVFHNFQGPICCLRL